MLKDNPDVTPTPVTMNRLSQPVYDALVKQCLPPFVTGSTTAHQAGFMLGIQHVLHMLREGYVVSSS